MSAPRLIEIQPSDCYERLDKIMSRLSKIDLKDAKYKSNTKERQEVIALCKEANALIDKEEENENSTIYWMFGDGLDWPKKLLKKLGVPEEKEASNLKKAKRIPPCVFFSGCPGDEHAEHTHEEPEKTSEVDADLPNEFNKLTIR